MIDEVLLPRINAGLEAAGIEPIDFNRAFATVAKPGTELQTIERGISDMGYVSTLFHASELPLQNVSYMIPFGAEDPGLVIEVGDALAAEIPAMNEAYARPRPGAARRRRGRRLSPDDDFSDRRPRRSRRAQDCRARPGGQLAPGHGRRARGLEPQTRYYNDINLGVYDGAPGVPDGRGRGEAARGRTPRDARELRRAVRRQPDGRHVGVGRT